MSGDPSLHDREDDQLLTELRGAIDSQDAIPDRLVESAKAAYVWRTIDEELAQLQYDSLAEAGAAVRSAETAVHLTFGASETFIEVDVTSDGILGQVIPPVAEVRLIHGNGDTVVGTCDEDGRFRFERPRSGPARLVAVRADGEVTTEWFTI